MMQFGLVGEKLSHSFSPEIHKKLGDYKYELCEVPKDKIDDFFRAREFSGLNVTIPYKETVIPHLDQISDAAKGIGAVNTVVMRGGKLFGDNTDWIGMRDTLLRAGIEIGGKKVLICGSGGTSKTAYYVAKILGASEIICLSRSERKGFITYEEAYSFHSDAGVIINTTPSGMYPNVNECPIDISRFEKLSGVFDAVFNPLRTNLVLEAKKRNIKAAGGLFMLVSQAAAASEIFTDTPVQPSLTERIYNELKCKKENIVLVGMPSSGKTSVGKAVSELLGREFIDTDVLITEKAGMQIPEIFEKYGEKYFRELERDVIEELSPRQSLVIATGGGAVLKEENVHALLRNGRIFFLDRSLKKLTVTDDRPLSKDRESLEKRYNERMPVYKSVSDVTVDGNGTVMETARLVTELFKGD